MLAAADTMRSTRGHACLLLYNAGNEIFPPNETWAPVPLSALAESLDPRGTPFEWSSMGNITEWWIPDKVRSPFARVCMIIEFETIPIFFRFLRQKTGITVLTTNASTSTETLACRTQLCRLHFSLKLGTLRIPIMNLWLVCFHQR